MNDLVKQIVVGTIMVICFMIAMLAIAIVWFCVVIYAAFDWVISRDWFSKKKQKDPVDILITNHEEFVKKHELDPKLEAEIDKAFAPKPFPEPYSPDKNPMYMSVSVKKPRHNLRGSNGRFLKRTVVVEPVRTPVTRYGVPTSERFRK